MGLISWFKDKYNNHKFQKAKELLLDGKKEQAVEIFKEILNCHPDAPSELLSIYHSDIVQGNSNRISDVATLYENHHSVKNECIDFAKRLETINNVRSHINYCQALYSKGIHELLNPFVTSATKFVVNANNVDNLKILTNNNSLLCKLSDSILIEAQKNYAQKSNLRKAEQLCLLIRPYLRSTVFYELYSNIRFDLITQSDVTEDSIKQLDTLFRDINNVYHLPDTIIKTFTDKRLEFANSLFERKNYIAALLVSQQLISKYVNARNIYADSALKLYVSANPRTDIIDSETLYKCFGNLNSEQINKLEPFIPYSTHRQKYISIVTKELTELATAEKLTQAESLFLRSWELTSDNNLITTVLSTGSSKCKTHFASLIANSDKIFLSNNSSLMCYVEELSKLENVEFIVATLETLLEKGKNVNSNYETQILRLGKIAKNKSRKRVEIIERGLTKIQTNRLYKSEAEYLNDYIDSGYYDSKFARNISSSLIAHSDLAEILIAKILIDEAAKNPDSETREKKLREALSIKNTHNKLFNKTAYKALLPQIQKEIIELAKELYITDQIRAIELLYLLRDNNLSWFDTYASLYLESIQNEDCSEEIASKILNIIAEGAGSDSSIFNELWSKYVSIKCLIISSTDNDDAISKLTNLHSELESLCKSNNKEDLQKEISLILSKRLSSRAKEYERDKIYDKAIENYKRIISVSEKTLLILDIRARILICKLKDSQSLLDTDKDEIDSLLSTDKNKKYQKDLAYRWCIYLISQGLIEKAEEINVRILNTDSEIAQICQEERIERQQRILDELNQRISKLNQAELTAEEAIAFGQSLSRTLSDISLIVQVSTQKSNILKESIRLYAIEKFYQQGNYVQSINGLKVHDSTYLSDPIALRNIAIMSLNAAENGLLTETNYRELLAIWITTIYQQKIFIESLNYTSWDDPYTFTLESALGQLDYNEEELPDNVNYETPSDNKIVSILEVQKTLLSRMETAIQDKPEYHRFFSSQLEAMDKLAEQELDEHCELVAPYMLEISNTYKRNVSKALELEAERHYGNWEIILEIGCLYGLNNGDFNKYASAMEALNTAIASIEHKQNIEYHKFNSEYGVVVKNIGDDSLSFIFSNYINQQVVKALNDKTQTLSKGTPILFEIYNFCKCNPHLKRNLENIIEALIHNYISDGDDDNLIVLDKALTATREFDPVVVKSLKGNGDVPEEMLILLFSSNENRFNKLKEKIGRKSSIIQNQFTATATKISAIRIQIELSQIVEQVNNNTINKCDALQKVYNIYKNNKNNSSVCKNLATLIPMCIMEYVIADKYGKSKVEVVLDSLKLNMSSTFRTQNSEIGDAYTMIWNQLPYTARSAIQNNPASLNDKGKALKKGLDYLRDLK